MGLTDERSIDEHSVFVYFRNLSQVPSHPKKITYTERGGSNRLITALESFRRKFSGRKDFVHFIQRLSRNIKFFL